MPIDLAKHLTRFMAILNLWYPFGHGESVYLPGGTCTTVVDKWATRVLENGADALLGRFSWVTMAGKQNKKVTFVSVVSVKNGPSECR
jgi:hypothetical protein